MSIPTPHHLTSQLLRAAQSTLGFGSFLPKRPSKTRKEKIKDWLGDWKWRIRGAWMVLTGNADIE